MEHTRKLAKFCFNLDYDRLPADVVQKAKLCVLDCIANIYGSLELKAVQHTIDYVRTISPAGSSTVLGCGFSTDIHHAVFLNGTTAEAIEAQDGLRFGGNHPGTAVIPAALAAAEKTGAGGKKIIEAVVAGYEAANRPAAAMHPWHTLSGFLPTGTCGTFGAAAAAAKIFNHNEEKMLNAMGNAGFVAPISMAEQLMGGHTIKIIQGGQASAAGVMAAGLAGRGLTGCPQALEGSALKGGFTQITTKVDPKFDKLSDGLGEQYSIMDIYFKPYTACRHTHGAIQATLELAQENRISSEDISEIKVFTYGIAVLAVGKQVRLDDSFVNAQFSIPYVVAASLLDGQLGPRQLTGKRLADPSLIELAGKIAVLSDDLLNGMYPDKTASRVEVNLKDGRTIVRQIDIPKGDPRDPMNENDIANKVKAYSGNRDQKKISEVVSMILHLDKLMDIRTLTKMI
ncbi:MAG: MmgE/PrpD family protein [Desulfobacterales bacterium]|jgi:2-methylcitrate dehydratase PrpD|nr:MmgE/PrpD family protein [Desulfobacterales bacterium]